MCTIFVSGVSVRKIIPSEMTIQCQLTNCLKTKCLLVIWYSVFKMLLRLPSSILVSEQRTIEPSFKTICFSFSIFNVQALFCNYSCL